jgi:hypothetical protein
VWGFVFVWLEGWRAASKQVAAKWNVAALECRVRGRSP